MASLELKPIDFGPGFLASPIKEQNLYINGKLVPGIFFDFGEIGIMESESHMIITEDHIQKFLETGFLFD